jgi:hypothetical protein
MNTATRFLAAILLTLTANANGANLITNGSFETFVVGSNDTNMGGFFRFFTPPANTDITGWTVTGSSGGNPNNVDDVNISLYPAYVGNYSLDLEGAIGASGVISQSFATTAGVTYDLSFAYGNNPYGGDPGARANVLVTGAGVLLNQDISHNTSIFAGSMNYSLFSQNFVADSSTTTLQFSALTNSGFGIALDAVSVDGVATTGVPEPATLSLIGLGLAGAGFMRRRKVA